jgi:hypothetical protein
MDKRHKGLQNKSYKNKQIDKFNGTDFSCLAGLESKMKLTKAFPQKRAVNQHRALDQGFILFEVLSNR